MAAVLLHRGQDGLGLEARGLESCPRNVAALRVGRDAKNGSSSVVNPVGREEAAEGGDEGAPTIILDGFGEGADFRRRLDEAEVVDEELDAGAGNGNTTF